mmetsp:Transcript_4432/g.6138  ORF Transcript_4432/g.6138 Transcript_4432/m.6138 type:complete len:201 (-) Transcript_4432:328-930(-)
MHHRSPQFRHWQEESQALKDHGSTPKLSIRQGIPCIGSPANGKQGQVTNIWEGDELEANGRLDIVGRAIRLNKVFVIERNIFTKPLVELVLCNSRIAIRQSSHVYEVTYVRLRPADANKALSNRARWILQVFLLLIIEIGHVSEFEIGSCVALLCDGNQEQKDKAKQEESQNTRPHALCTRSGHIVGDRGQSRLIEPLLT